MFTKNRKLIVARIALVLALVVGVLGVIPVQARAEKPGEITPTVDFLNPDGTLKLDGSVSGSLDLQGWDVSIDDVKGPVFSPKSAETLSPLVAATLGEWSALGDNGTGNGALNGQVFAIAVSGNDVYVGGNFTNAGGNQKADFIAKWDGTTWSNLGDNGVLPSDRAEGALVGPVFAIAVDESDVYIGTGGSAFWFLPEGKYVAKWDGTTWSALGGDGVGGSSINGNVVAIAIDGNDVYVGGNFTNVKNGSTTLPEADYLAKWDGTNWSAVGNNGAGNGSLNNMVHTIAVKGTDLYVGGNFTDVKSGAITLIDADYIAKWDGTSWSALGNNGGSPLNGSISGAGAGVYDIDFIGDDFYVAGMFVDVNNYGTTLNAADYIAKWDGTNWSALGDDGSGDGAISNSSGYTAIGRIAVDGNNVYVGGYFQNVNNGGSVLTAADYVAKWDGMNWSALGSNGGTPPNSSLNTLGEGTVVVGNDNLYVGGTFANVNNNGTILNTADYIALYGLCTTGPITVQNTNDLGVGSLRQAIADICPGGTINFDSSLSGEIITLASFLAIDKDMTIDGSSLSSKIELSGSSSSNGIMSIGTQTEPHVILDSLIFINDIAGIGQGNGIIEINNSTFSGFQNAVQSSAQLTVNNVVFFDNNVGIVNFGVLQVSNSSFSNNGLGIYNEKVYYFPDPGEATIMNSMFTLNSQGGGIVNQNGTLTVTDSYFANNTSSYNGGGIENNGTSTITNSQFIGNSAIQNGGGIHNGGGLTVVNSKFSGNTAGNNGGGITGYGGLTVSGSVFLNNTAGNFGGGLDARQGLLLTNTTFYSNSATSGGGIYVDTPSYSGPWNILKNNTISDSMGGGLYINDGSIDLFNTIMTNSLTGSDCFTGSTALLAGSNNLIENDSSSPNSCSIASIADDPLLQALADNGGFTQTMALSTSSPAIDAGDDGVCPDTDQRGVERPQGSHCDIGAYEFDDMVSIDVLIGNGSPIASYELAPNEYTQESYVGVDNGPVRITSTNGVPVVASMRALWKLNGVTNSYAELMGLPKEQLSSEYWFPWYNFSTPTLLDEQFRFANADTSTTTVEVSVGSTVLGEYELDPGESWRQSYPGLDNGPIRIRSKEGKKIIAAMRAVWLVGGQFSSYSELMGLPKEQLSEEYWFPWYNFSVPTLLDEQFRFANADTSTTTVEVSVGSTVLGEYELDPGESWRQSYPGLDNGPIRIRSKEGKKIIAAMRAVWLVGGKFNSYSELMGVPKGQLSDEYWIPLYDNATPSQLDEQLRFANADVTTTTIEVSVGSTVLGEYELDPGESWRQSYNLKDGPIRIRSQEGSKIIAGMRAVWVSGGQFRSYSELMGVPQEMLSEEYWFPWYNFSVPSLLDEQFNFAVP